MSQQRLAPDGRNVIRRAVTPQSPYPPIVEPPATPQSGRPGAPIAWLALAWAAGICILVVVTVALVMP